MTRTFEPELFWVVTAGEAAGWKAGAAVEFTFGVSAGLSLIAAPHAVQNCPLTGVPQLVQKFATFPSRSPRARNSKRLGQLFCEGG
jgi:hypothetical protein